MAISLTESIKRGVSALSIAALLAAGLNACSGGSDNSSGTSSSSGSTNPPGGGEPATEQATLGEQIYRNPIEGGTTFACATCHALTEPAADGLRRAGHPIGDALRRQSYKNGQLNTFLDAANTCLNDWINISTPWTQSSEQFTALVDYLESEDTGTGTTTDVTFTIMGESVPSEAFTGDITRGQAAFNETCASCHGVDAQGGLNVGFALAGIDYSEEQIARKVRTSGPISSNSVYTGLTGGRMPFWSLERLSNQELGDIIAYLRSTVSTSSSGSSSSNSTSSSSSGGQTACTTNHPSVGQTTTLSTLFHGVSGLATIVDDCSIEITGFNYDGQGITVYVYGGLGGNYSDRNGGPGFPIGMNLIRSTPYADETLRVTLPPNKTLDDLDGVSIWCSDVDISFGDGMFN